MKKYIYLTSPLILLLSGCSLLPKVAAWWPHDNFLEEIAEDAIDKELGWKVDLTPFSPEE